MVATLPIDTSLRPQTDEAVAGDKVVAGAPATGFAAVHDDEATGFYSGIWASSVGAWRVAYEESELCVILEGRVRLASDDGSSSEYGPGAAFVIPRGFTGVWETIEACRKIYAIAT